MTSARPLSIHAWLFTAIVVVVCVAALARARTFQPPPIEAELIDGRMAQAFEAHYDEAFPVRTFGISVWAAIDYALFREARNGVVIGLDDWLYTDEEFIVPNDVEGELARNLALISHVQDRLTAQGIRLLMVIVPAKTRVYPEYLGSRKPPAVHRELYDRAAAELHSAGIVASDLFPALVAGKAREPTYLRTDTHWTPFGAKVAAMAVARYAERLLPAPHATADFVTQRNGAGTHRGDLFNFLPLEPWFAWLMPPAEQIPRVVTHKVDAAASLLGESSTPEVALVGTSYSAHAKWNFHGALQEALRADVGNYAREGLGPYAPMFEYLKSADFREAPPKLVIWELPERYLVTRQALEQYDLPPEAFRPRQTKPDAPLIQAALPPPQENRHDPS